MVGCAELKQRIAISNTDVECPVAGCCIRVPRQRKVFQRDRRFQCPEHLIYISPSTFEYEAEWDNLLWADDSDRAYLCRLKEFKRESRMARDNSEDAVTFNVFRYLQRNGLLDDFLSKQGHAVRKSDLVLWSYHEGQGAAWDMLNRARMTFGERPDRGSEPDVIIITDEILFFIEAKVLAFNETIPSNTSRLGAYESAENSWYQHVFRDDIHAVACEEKRYELMRFWLLGTWMAQELGLKFELLSLVLKRREAELEEQFGRLIVQDDQKCFSRISWEDMYQFIHSRNDSSAECGRIEGYFSTKCLGYDDAGCLIKAFDVTPWENYAKG